MHAESVDRLKIQAAAIAGLREVLAAGGVDVRALLRSVGISDTPTCDPMHYISLTRFARLLETAAATTGDELFALRLALTQKAESAGALTYAMINAPTVRDGLLAMIRFIPTRVDLARLDLVIAGSRAHLEWSPSPLIMQRSQFIDYGAASMSRRIALMIGAPWHPRAVRLERPEPVCARLHQRLLGRDVAFGQPVNVLTFDAATLDLPIVNPDAELRRVAIELLERLLSERPDPDDLMAQLREEILSALERGHRVRVARVARRLGMSTRSLQRRLSVEGATFQQALDDCRRRLARRYLAESELSLTEIAYRLGFSGPSAFTRSAYRWYGAKPSVVRRRLNGAPRAKAGAPTLP